VKPPRQKPLHLKLELVRAAEVEDRNGVARNEDNRYVVLDPSGRGHHTEGHFSWGEQEEQQLDAMADPADAAEAANALATQMDAFLEGAGWGKISQSADQARRSGQPVTVTVSSTAHELSALPWELAKIGESQICDLPNCLLRFDCLPDDRGSPAAVDHAAEGPKEEDGKHQLEARGPAPGGRLLFVSAGASVPLEEQLEAIAASASAAFDRRRDVLRDATLASILGELEKPEPPVVILHLLCHGERLPDRRAYGLRLEDELVSPDELLKRLGPALSRARVRLVVLSACLSSTAGAIDNAQGSIAEAFRKAKVPVVIGAREPITTAGSITFTRALYRGLFVDLCSVEEAFLAARNELQALPRAEGQTRHPDAAALQLHSDSSLGLDFRPWIIEPYRGLAPYRLEDARLFFGRTAERRELCQRVAATLGRPTATRFLLVTGASGTGKSSLVMAGLLDDLIEGRLYRDDPDDPDGGEASAAAAGPRWTAEVIRPSQPDALPRLQRLLEERSAQAASSMLALVLDPLEELFTGSLLPSEREELLRALWQLAHPAQHTFVIVTSRLETISRLGSLRRESHASFEHHMLKAERTYLVRQPSAEEYAEIIDGPAELAGLHVAEGLRAALTEELQREPGALPLLSYALAQLWKRRRFDRTSAQRGWWLTDGAYEAIGGLSGAVIREADRVTAALALPEQQELRRTLVQLVRDHEDPELLTRQRHGREAMRPAEPAAALAYDRAIDAMISARLLVQSGETPAASSSACGAAPAWLELADDSLVRSWPQLRSWYQDARAWLVHTDELRRLAAVWRASASSSSTRATEEYLLRGERLINDRALWQLHCGHLGADDRRDVQDFLATSERAEQARQRQAAALRHDVVKDRIVAPSTLIRQASRPFDALLRYELRLLAFFALVGIVGAIFLGRALVPLEHRLDPRLIAAPAAPGTAAPTGPDRPGCSAAPPTSPPASPSRPLVARGHAPAGCAPCSPASRGSRRSRDP
jgi:CHAT domain